jgi:hypothetical protein
MKTILGIILTSLVFIACKHDIKPIIKNDNGLIKPIDSMYAYESYSGVLKWNDSSTVHILKLVSNSPFITLKEGDTISLNPTSINLGSNDISLKIVSKSDVNKADTLKWKLTVLNGITGMGKLSFTWTTGLSGAAATTYINLRQGSLTHSYSFPSCKSTGTIAFDNIEVGDWDYDVIRGKLCNAPCGPSYYCPDTSFITHGTIAIFKNQTTQLSK